MQNTWPKPVRSTSSCVACFTTLILSHIIKNIAAAVAVEQDIFLLLFAEKKLYWNFLGNNNHHRVGKAFVGWSQISYKTSLFLVVFFTSLLAEPKEFRLIDPGPPTKEQSASIKILFKRSRIVHQLTREIFFDSIKHPSRGRWR